MKNSTKLIKESGVKITKEMSEYYIYNGINFKVKFNKEHCETSWWEINITEEDVDSRVEHKWSYMGGGYDNKFETKKDLVWALFSLDTEITELEPSNIDLENI